MRCEHCPIAPGSRCAADECGGRVADLCALARGGEPHWIRHIVGRAGLPCPGGAPAADAGLSPAERRARKPRMALGTRQKPPPGCKTCGQAASLP